MSSMNKETGYCCLENVLTKCGYPFFKVILKNGRYHNYQTGRVHWALNGWPPDWTPATRIKNHPEIFAYADCEQCKHKFVCLVNKEATVVFENR